MAIYNQILHVKEAGSTNEELKLLAKNGAPHGTVFLADRQTKGRGRMGRTWDSPEGDNIYMSVLLRPELDPSKASMLTLVIALAIAEGLEEVMDQAGNQPAIGIKWPNDLVWKGRKVCGILTEMSAAADRIRYVIVGIGINVNRKDFPEELAHMAAGIPISAFPQGKEQKKGGKEAVVERLLYHIEEKYQLFCEKGDLSPFVESYNRRLSGLYRQVQILSRKDRRMGISQGIDETGALLVKDESGKIEKIISGEVSVRGLYGYVDE